MRSLSCLSRRRKLIQLVPHAFPAFLAHTHDAYFGVARGSFPSVMHFSISTQSMPTTPLKLGFILGKTAHRARIFPRL
jgi:hypothetical protein